ncbi:MAG: hypothetical protein ACI4MR_01025 [Candidatus Aphodomorpha sp.]
MEYRVGKRAFLMLRVSLAVYLLIAILLFSQVLLGVLLLAGVAPEGGLTWRFLWNGAHYSPLLLAVETALFLYCLYGILDVYGVIRRVRKVVLRIADDEVCGVELPRPHVWQSGKPFAIAPGDIVSIGVLDVKLHGRTTAQSLLINTANDRYFLPALEDMQKARKHLESVRSRAQSDKP